MRLLQDKQLQITISGPAPSFHHKHGNEFEWQLIIKAKKRSELQKVIQLLPANWSYDLDPTNLL
jgi:primosomal protein N'